MSDNGAAVKRLAAALMVATLVLFPFAQIARAASVAADAASPSLPTVAQPAAGASTTPVVIPSVSLDTTFAPLPRGSRSPWDGEVVLDGIDGLSYNSPGTEVRVRASSSNAFFVDEVWLVYPRVQYLFNNKDIADPGGALGQIAFSGWVSVGTFPPGTELIFGVKTGVGIDNTCADRTNPDGSVDPHHCYALRQTPSFVPLAPDPLRVCAMTDDTCRNKAWPSQTPDGRSIFYTGPGLRNVKDNSPHGRFQYLTNTLADGTGTPLTNTALFGLEDVGAPLAPTGATCPTAKELAALKTTTDVVVSTAPQTVGLNSVAGLTVGAKIQIYQPFQRETVTITAIDSAAKTITAVFSTPDSKPYPAGTSWAPDGCAWHPDFQDAGVVVWPALAATCQATTVQNKVAIVGQEGYGNVILRDSTQTAPFSQTFKPGDLITFTTDAVAPISVTGASPSWTINLHGQAVMTISDPSAPVSIVDANGATIPNPNKTLDGGICFDPVFPPLPLIPATISAKVCATTGWDFTISSVTATTAPPSVRVTFTNAQTPPADEATTIPLTSVGIDGVAHYTSDLFTSLTVVTATASKPSATWTGTFSLVSGPCPAPKTADLTLACPVAGATLWDITITGTTQAQAPAKISVTWQGGTPTDVLLSGPVVDDASLPQGSPRGVAHYTSAANLTLPITAATAMIQGAWSGTFTVNGAQCPGAKHLSVTTVPPCTASVTAWDFTISSVTTALAPASISALWTGQTTAEAVSLTGTVGADGIAHYTTTSHTGATFLALISASADLTFASQADATAFTGTLAVAGVPCPPPSPSPSTPPPSPSPSPCVTPSPTPRPTPTRSPGTSPKPASGGGTKGGTRAGGSNTGSGSSSKAGTSEGSKAGAGGSASGTHSSSKAGTNDGSKACAKPSTNHGSPSPTPRPSPSTPPPSTSPQAGTVHVKASTLIDHSCDTAQWHFVITSVTSPAPSTIVVRFANGQTVVVSLDGVTGGTAHYRTTQSLSSAVIDATATLPSTWRGQFNVSSGPCATHSSATESPSPSPSASPSHRAETSPSPSPSASPSHRAETSPSPSPAMQIVSSVSSGGSRTITLRIRIPGTEDFRTVTVTMPDR